MSFWVSLSRIQDDDGNSINVTLGFMSEAPPAPKSPFGYLVSVSVSLGLEAEYTDS